MKLQSQDFKIDIFHGIVGLFSERRRPKPHFLDDNQVNFVAHTQHCVSVSSSRLRYRSDSDSDSDRNNSKYSPSGRLYTQKSFPENSTSFLGRNILQNFSQNAKTKLKMADNRLGTTEHARTAKLMWSRDMEIR